MGGQNHIQVIFTGGGGGGGTGKGVNILENICPFTCFEMSIVQGVPEKASHF